MKRPPSLSSKERRHLRSLAHDLDPIVRIGEKGITDGLLGAIDRALEDHELVKVRILEGCPTDRKEVAPQLADPLHAHAVGLIGRVCILYRRHPEKPTISLKTNHPGRAPAAPSVPRKKGQGGRARRPRKPESAPPR